MAALHGQILLLLAYLPVACLLRRRPPAFAVVNLVASLALFGVLARPRAAPGLMVLYIGLVLALYAAIFYLAPQQQDGPRRGLLATVAPLLLPFCLPLLARATPVETGLSLAFVGASYQAFRLSALAVAVQGGEPPPPLWRFLGFAFFLPTLAIGPISGYRRHLEGQGEAPPPWTAIGRVLVGACKLLLLAPVFLGLSYPRLLALPRPYGVLELLLAILCYPVYLYAEFSGACDIIIGGAALVGVPVAENFNAPFAARNVKDFWNRWHCTLSEWTRDLIFYPVSREILRRWPAAPDLAIIAGILCVFLAIGVWHGPRAHYLAFGLWHAAGVIANHLYTNALRRRLGAQGLRAYLQRPWLTRLMTAATFLYVAAGFALFANDVGQLATLWRGLR